MGLDMYLYARKKDFKEKIPKKNLKKFEEDAFEVDCDSLDSSKENGFSFKEVILPAAEFWILDGSIGVVLPVKIYLPNW